MPRADTTFAGNRNLAAAKTETAKPEAVKTISVTQEEMDLFIPLDKPRFDLIACGFDGQSAQEFELTIDEFNALKRELSRLRGYKVSKRTGEEAA